MKKIFVLAIMACMALSVSAQKKNEKKDEVMTKNKGVYTINTTTLCQARGFKGTTPLIVSIKKDVIQSVEALRNMETPRFFQPIVEQMLPNYQLRKIADIDKVDIITGATYSSKAVKANVDAAVKYYQEHK